MSNDDPCFIDALTDAVQSVDLSGSWVDVGVGHYECRGAPDYDSREVFEVTDLGEAVVEWVETPAERDEGPLLESRMSKIFFFGRDDEHSMCVEIPVVLDKATVTREAGGTYRWRATYLVGE